MATFRAFVRIYGHGDCAAHARHILNALILAGIGLVASMAGGTAFAQTEFPKAGSVGLDAPDGMVMSSRFAGFEDVETGASILVAEMPAQAFGQLNAGFTADALLSKGIVAGPREDRSVAGAEQAFLVRATQSVQGVDYDKWMLVAGGSAATALITVQVPQEVDAYPDEAIEAALASVTLRAPGSIDDQIAALPFRLGDTGGLRAVSVFTGSTLLLTDGPKDTFDDGEQLSVVVASGLGDGVPVPEAREAFARRALSTLAGVAGIDVQASDTFDLDGSAWTQLEATASSSDNGADLYVLQVVRFMDDRYLRFVAMAPAARRDAVRTALIQSARSMDAAR